MCLSCVELNIPIENSFRETGKDWITHLIKIKLLLVAQMKIIFKKLGKEFFTDDDLQKPKKIAKEKRFKSYLVRNSEVFTMDTTGRVFSEVGILKNGNRANEKSIRAHQYQRKKCQKSYCNKHMQL